MADTCVVVWLANDQEKLSGPALTAIAEARKNGLVAVSGITLYELAWLAIRKKIAAEPSVEAFLKAVESRFQILPITVSIAKLANELPISYPSDPMDRIIGATALDAGCALITPDRLIRKSKAVPVIW